MQKKLEETKLLYLINKSRLKRCKKAYKLNNMNSSFFAFYLERTPDSVLHIRYETNNYLQLKAI